MRDKELINKMVKDVIKHDAQKEAILILEVCDDKWYDDFTTNYQRGSESSSWNICCMVLDFAKHDLVKTGKMTQNKTDHFGNIGWMFNESDVGYFED